MQKKPAFHLFIPSLLQPLSIWYNDFLFEVKATHLSTLLNQLKKTESNKVTSINSAFFSVLNPEYDELPIAYYRQQIHNSIIHKSLICADPVHLEVGMNDVTLTNKISDLTEDEAKELVSVLNKHFEQDGLQFFFGSTQCWYVSFPENEIIQSHDLDSVLSTNIIDKNVHSEQRNWQVIQNETQMILHDSDVNKQREIAGLQSVNSLWYWGAGKPIVSNLDIDKIHFANGSSSKQRAQMFAKAANCESQALPQNFTKLLDQIEQDNSTQVLLLDQLLTHALEDDLEGFQQELNNIDENIIRPLLHAWQRKQIEIIIDCCDGTVLNPQRVPAWKFWTKSKSLRAIAG